MVVPALFVTDICSMKFNTETIYLKAIELRKLLSEDNKIIFGDDYLKEKFDKLSQQIPFHIGMCVNVNDVDDTRYHLKKIRRKLSELEVIIDLVSSEFFKIDMDKFDSIVDEIRIQMDVVLEKAEEAHEKWMEEIMKPFMVQEETSEESVQDS